MADQSFPITPTPELVQQWIPAGWNCSPNTFTTLLMRIADNAALWSYYNCRSEIKAAADQELEACCEWIPENCPWDADQLRAARRPKPPSLRKQALALVEQHEDGWRPAPKDWDTIRRALEALPND